MQYNKRFAVNYAHFAEEIQLKASVRVDVTILKLGFAIKATLPQVPLTLFTPFWTA